MSKKFDIVIVGAGVGGLVLALVMAKKGFRVALLDREKYPRPLPRGEILQPNGLKILDQLGFLKDLLRADVYLNKKVHFYQSSGSHLCTIDYTRLQTDYAYALVLLPSVLHEILLNALAAAPEIEAFWGTTFEGVAWNASRVVGASAVRDGKSLTFECPMVIGADGAGSRVRTAFQIKHRAHAYADGYATMVVDRPEGFKEESHYYLGREMIFGAFPVSQKQTYLFYLVPTIKLEEIKQRGLNFLKNKILSLRPEIDALFQRPLEAVTTWEQTAYMRCFRVVCQRWVVHGGALLGDAAHAMNPHVAQGRNAAMVDAMILAEVLGDCFDRGDFSQKMLAPYEAARKGDIQILQALGDEMSFFWNSGFLPLVWLRDRVFKKVEQRSQLHDKLLKTVSGIQMAPFNLMDRINSVCP